MRRFSGRFESPRPSPHPDLASSPAAVIDVRVAIGNAQRTLQFQIDSGAAHTVLQPTDALNLLGESYRRLDFFDAERTVLISGIEAGSVHSVVQTATLSFTDDTGSSFLTALPILIAQPNPVEPSDSGNWLLPSLLGRDILRVFDLEMSYNSAEATLILR